MQAAQQQPPIDSQPEHPKTLLAAFPQILVAGRDHSTVLAGSAELCL